MDTPNDTTPLKQCTRKELCVNPDNQDGWLPASLEYFGKHGNGLRAQCRMCRRITDANSRAQNRERQRVYDRKYYDSHKEQSTASTMRWREKNRDRYEAYIRQYDAEHLAERRRYRHENKERIAERKRQYRETHKAQKAEYDYRYRMQNKERIAERNRLFYSRKKHIILMCVRKHYADNRDQALETRRRYHKTHPEVSRAAGSRRRSKKRDNGGTHTAHDIRLHMKGQTDKWGNLHCWWCGKVIKEQYHVDHRIPLNRGGSNFSENLCISCPHCNLSKGTKLPHEFSGRLF